MQVHLGCIEVDLTPPAGVWMGGFGARQAPADGMHDPLSGHVTWLDDGKGGALLLLTLDFCAVEPWWSEPLELALCRTHGLSSGQLRINCSHTHSGPLTTYAQCYAPSQRVAHRFMIECQERLLQASVEARSAARGMQLHYGSGACDIGVSRRFLEPDGTVSWKPDPRNERDPSLHVLVATDDAAKPVWTLFSYGCHPSIICSQQWSAEWPGAARRWLKQMFEDVTAVFVQGCAGDQKVHLANEAGLFRSGTWTDVEATGHRVAQQVQAVVQNACQPIRDEPLRWERQQVRLDYQHVPTVSELEVASQSDDPLTRQWAMEALRNDYRELWLRGEQMTVSAWRIGDLAWLGLSGEPVAGYALRLRASHRSENLLSSGYCQGLVAYLPTAAMLSQGGYEVDQSMRVMMKAGPWDPSIESRVINACDTVLRTCQAVPTTR